MRIRLTRKSAGALALAAIIAGIGSFCAGCQPEPAPVVLTRSGSVRGIVDNGVFAYMGIPFAAPPVGDLRWRLPEKETPWERILEADAIAAVCPQDIEGQSNIYRFGGCAEDCLHLNVWTPEISPEDPAPVMFWIPGGGYEGGGTAMDLYNGAALVKKGIVLVSANYRLGPLGFLVTDEMYGAQGQTGNFGLFDVIAALEWVQENISAFGGDPDQVTVFGESSGGGTAALLQNMPMAQGLFQRVIAMSGTGSSTKYITGRNSSFVEAAGVGAKYMTALREAGLLSDTGGIEEMRAISAEDLIAVALENQIYFGPVMDGVLLDADPRELATGPAAAPMMIGTVRDESTLFFAVPGMANIDEDNYDLFLDSLFGEEADTVREAYPASTSREERRQAMRVYNLAAFFEPIRHTALGVARTQPVYRYHFTHTPPTLDALFIGCHHGGELAYIFGVVPWFKGYGRKDRQLADEMMELWTSFARTGRPSAPEAPDWPAYNAESDAILTIQGPGNYEVTQGLWDDSGSLEAECDFFRDIATITPPDFPD